MSLSPADVREVEFVISRRGYDEKQVDDFLDLVVLALEERDAALAEAAASRTEASQHSVVDLFSMAQRSAEQHVAVAEAAAEELVAKAHQEAAQVIASAQHDAARLRATVQVEYAAEVDELRRERDRVEGQLEEQRQLLGRTRAELEHYLGKVFDAVRSGEAAPSGPHAVPRSA